MVNPKSDIKKSQLKVGYQGVKGSFSEQALKEQFGSDIISINVEEFVDIFEALKNNDIDYGVLPIENSSTGGISDVYDLLRQYGFYIVGERCIKIEHQLMGIEGTRLQDIKEVYSHPQAFSQSSKFFKNNKQIITIPYKNTATSAKYICEEQSKHKAAVASKKAALLYGLEIIETNINDNKYNYTRFIIIGKNKEIESKANKISIIVSTSHKPGALYDILGHFANNNLNMLKIESRPIVNKSWEYFFYIDFEGNLEDDVVKLAIDAIRNNSSVFQLLGNYKAYDMKEID